MAGNELEVVKYLINNLGSVSLNHLGLVKHLGAPRKNEEGFTLLTNEQDLNLVSTSDRKKKADIYINGFGVSLKQEGGNFSFNRLQRKSLEPVFNLLSFDNIKNKIEKLDQEVKKFHENNQEEKRNVTWSVFFTEKEFYQLTELLMMKYSPADAYSQHPAALMLVASKEISKPSDINVFTFEEYFHLKKNNLKISIRRQWIGQDSVSEHNRAVGMAKVLENAPWVFNKVAGKPKTGWRAGFPESDKKTVYFLMIEEEKEKKLKSLDDFSQLTLF